MINAVARQLAADYCCEPGDVLDASNHFTVFAPRPERRVYTRTDDFLKIAVVNGKLLFTGRDDIIRLCAEKYGCEQGEWFCEYDKLSELDALARTFGHSLKFARPFFASDEMCEAIASPFPIRLFLGSEIEQFRGDSRFSEAYSFSETAPDVLGAGATDGGEYIGMAGASADSPLMWQIGINVNAAYRGRGLAAALVAAVKNEVLRAGRIPYYSTSIAHLASQRVALKAGFVPAWFEIAFSEKA